MTLVRLFVLFLSLSFFSHASAETFHTKGVDLFYQVMGEGTPIILVHGGPGGSHDYLRPQMDALLENAQLIYYDQRGSGRSYDTELNEHTITVEQFVEDIHALQHHLGHEKVVLLGHSWGGYLAMQYAAHHPDKLSGLILIGAAPGTTEAQKAMVEEAGRRTGPLLDKIPAWNDEALFFQLNETELESTSRMLHSVYFYYPENLKKLSLEVADRSGPQGGFIVRRLLSKSEWLNEDIDLLPALGQAPYPALIIHGFQDLVPYWTAQETAKTIPNSTLVGINQCVHFPSIEYPEVTFGAIRTFLEGL